MNTTSHNCVYIYCENNDRRQKGKSFFKFPIRNLEKTKEWQRNCGNLTIADMSIEELKHKLLCEDHFLPDDIIVGPKNSKRKLLRRKAVPIRYNPPTYQVTLPVNATSYFVNQTAVLKPNLPVFILKATPPQPAGLGDVVSHRCSPNKQKLASETNSEEKHRTEDNPQPSAYEPVAPLLLDIKQEPEADFEEDTKLFQIPSESNPQPSTLEDVAPLPCDVKQELACDANLEEDTKLFQTAKENPTLESPSEVPKVEADDLSKYLVFPSVPGTTSDEAKVLQATSPSEVFLQRKIRKLKAEIIDWKKKVKAERSQSYRLREKLKGLTPMSVMENLLMDESDAVKTFVHMQLVNNNRQQWRAGERELALLLYQKSPSAYKYMREALKFHLPSPRIIQSWLKFGTRGEESSPSEEAVEESAHLDS